MSAYETAIWVLGMSLVSWRVTHLLVHEDGPFNILGKFRHLIGVRYDARSVPYGSNVIGEAFTCMWCLSVWVGVFLSVFIPREPPSSSMYAEAGFRVAVGLVISALTVLIDKAVNG